MVQLAAFMAIVLMLVYFWPVFLAVLGAVAVLAVIGALASSEEPPIGNESSLQPMQPILVRDNATFISGWFALLAFFMLLAYVWR